MSSENEELLTALRALAATRAEMAAAFLKLARVLAQDASLLADLAKPADSLEAIVVRGCRERAAKVLAQLGGDPEAAH